MNKTAFTRLAIDPSGVVWVATPLCYCGNSIRKFDGTNWGELWLWTNERHLEASQLLFTPDGTLWVAFGYSGEIGRYDGRTWKMYSGTDLGVPSNEWGTNIKIASDMLGNIFGVYEGMKWVVEIRNDGSVLKIPFDFSDLELNSTLLRLFVDRQDTFWVNACLKNSRNACLGYHRDNQWVVFTNLPFSTVADINESSDGTLLISTNEGLYQFKSTK
jgi:hypothetical protein